MITSAAFDLESSSLNADFGILLCAVIKPAGRKVIVFRGDDFNSRWRTRRSDDSDLTAAIAAELSKYDILAAHNGLMHDLSFLRTRLARWALKPLREVKMIDPVLILRRKFRLSYNSLARADDLFNLGGKTDVKGDVWMRAYLDGDVEALDLIVEHCKRDVAALERLVHIVKPYCPAFNSWGSS